MAAPLTASMPESLVLDHGYTVTLDAVDPTTGAPVAGVQITSGAVTGHQAVVPSERPPPTPVGPYMLVGGPQA